MLLGPATTRHSRSISLTPLIDIVFILLLFFILETNFLGLGELTFSLPSSEEGSESQLTTLRIQVFTDGRLWWNGQSFDLDSLSDKLADSTYAADTPVVLAVDKPVSVQHLVDLMDMLDTHLLKQVQLLPLEQ